MRYLRMCPFESGQGHHPPTRSKTAPELGLGSCLSGMKCTEWASPPPALQAGCQANIRSARTAPKPPDNAGHKALPPEPPAARPAARNRVGARRRRDYSSPMRIGADNINTSHGHFFQVRPSQISSQWSTSIRALASFSNPCVTRISSRSSIGQVCRVRRK